MDATPPTAAGGQPRPADPTARSAMHRALWQAGAALLLGAAIGGIGWLDYVTEPEIGFSLFYLVPTLIAGWWLGPPTTAAIAFAASVTWFIADEPLHPDSPMAYSIWNAFTRFVIFLCMGLLTARARDDRNRLRSLLERERRMARVDVMTSLPNRRGFIERLMMEASRCRRAGQPLAVAYLDLDNFKSVNDRYGHSAGDDMLARIGRALVATVRAGDMAARLGGDEFAILFSDADGRGVEGIARRIIERIELVGMQYPEAHVSASVGIADFARVPDSVEEILMRADCAMYEAKSAGKGRLAIWRSAPPARPAQSAAARRSS